MLEDRSAEGLQRWRNGMRALADCSNVNVKLSGLGTFNHAYRLDVVAPIPEFDAEEDITSRHKIFNVMKVRIIFCQNAKTPF
jgi:predicted TIM-barrel fold metal-dependent hydrolase